MIFSKTKKRLTFRRSRPCSITLSSIVNSLRENQIIMFKSLVKSTEHFLLEKLRCILIFYSKKHVQDHAKVRSRGLNETRSKLLQILFQKKSTSQFEQIVAH